MNDVGLQIYQSIDLPNFNKKKPEKLKRKKVVFVIYINKYSF